MHKVGSLDLELIGDDQCSMLNPNMHSKRGFEHAVFQKLAIICVILVIFVLFEVLGCKMPLLGEILLGDLASNAVGHHKKCMKMALGETLSHKAMFLNMAIRESAIFLKGTTMGSVAQCMPKGP